MARSADHVLVSRDGQRALLLVLAEGPAAVPDSVAVAFNTRLATKDRGPRTVVRLSGTVYETYDAEQLGLPKSSDKILDWYFVGEATLGDWIDELEPGTNLAGLQNPVVVRCTTYTIES